jgi:putative transposase
MGPGPAISYSRLLNLPMTRRNPTGKHVAERRFTMPRRPRIDVPGIPLHVVQRGNDRKQIFVDDEDRHRYLQFGLRSSRTHDVQVHAYVLMGNHVHLLLGSHAQGAVSGFMHDLGSNFAGWFNRRHLHSGTLWEGRFRSSLVDSSRYLWNCYRDIELNPVRAGLCSIPIEYPWSSHAANAHGERDALVAPRSEYLALGRSLSERCFTYRQLFAAAEATETFAQARLRRGATLGSQAFEAEIDALLGRTGQGKPRRGRPPKRQEKSDLRDALPLFAE